MFELCKVTDLEDDMPLECAGPNGKPIVVVRHDKKYYAVQGLCPHQEAPLAEGEVIDGTLVCCLHFWTWRLADGEPLEEADTPLKTYPVQVTGSIVYLTK